MFGIPDPAVKFLLKNVPMPFQRDSNVHCPSLQVTVAHGFKITLTQRNHMFPILFLLLLGGEFKVKTIEKPSLTLHVGEFIENERCDSKYTYFSFVK